MEVKKIMTDNINNGNIENMEERDVDAAAEAEVGVEAKVEVKVEVEVEAEADSVNASANANAKALNVKPVKDMTEKTENIDWDDTDQSFADLLDKTFATLNRGDRVRGTVSYVSDGEIHVDVGYKYTGILAYDEITDDSSVDLKEMFKVGDEIETQIIKTNDQEGIALLSKKRVDSTEVWDKVVKLHEEGTVAEGKVIQVVNGGIIVLLDSMRVFVPGFARGRFKGHGLADARRQKSQGQDYRYKQRETQGNRLREKRFCGREKSRRRQSLERSRA
jgi:4-hydroxy-3-methylbut-2-enyl diphosphate reductase